MPGNPTGAFGGSPSWWRRSEARRRRYEGPL
jgi:hypothetical protein